jgi:RNA polymerase sigma-70 factor (ECF subfamily)
MIYWQVRRMVISHEDADDLVQEIFIKVFENIESFHNESKLSTWIYRIAYNHTINHIKSKSTRLSKNNSSFEQEMFENLKSDSLFDGNEIELKLQKAMLSLPAKQRAVFQMRYYEELSFSQIAEITKTSEGALKASYHIAAKKIEEMMLNEDFSI